MNTDVSASIGANLEARFDEYSEYPVGTELPLTFTVPGEGEVSITLTLVRVGEIESPCGGEYAKCLAFKDEDGNLYFHFRGTGDGFWQENDAAYSDASNVQAKSLEFFEQLLSDYENNGLSIKDVYVSGHSQGGNTAQYVTINSKYGDYIDTCISLDGPGFSEKVVEDAKNRYGEAYFNRQCEKIYAYNGINDFVSPLGQVQIVPEGHTTYIGNQTPEGESEIMYYHSVEGMMDGSSLLFPPEGTVYESSDFRNLIVSLNDAIKDLPPEEQAEAALLAMKIAEMLLGNGKNPNDEGYQNLLADLSNDEFERFKDILFPLLIDYLAEHPDKIMDLLKTFDLSPEAMELIEDILKEFNSLPDDKRRLLLEAMGDLIVFKDGKLTFSGDILSFFEGILLAIPSFKDLIMENPDEIVAVLQELGVFDMIADWIKEHPLEAAGIIILAVLFLDEIIIVLSRLGAFVECLAEIIDFAIRIYDALENLAEDIKNFIINTLKAIKETIRKVREYIRKNSPGGRYVSSNPYFKADPWLLRDYASRLGKVNSRLVSLDGDLNDLYWQVELDDLWTILEANILTTYSAWLLSAQAYLNNAASTLENAEKKALQYMGG